MISFSYGLSLREYFLQLFPPGRFAQRHSLPSLPRLVVVDVKARNLLGSHEGICLTAFLDRAEITKMADHSHCESAEVEQLRLESILGSLKFIYEVSRTLYVYL